MTKIERLLLLNQVNIMSALALLLNRERDHSEAPSSLMHQVTATLVVLELTEKGKADETKGS